MSEKKSVIQAFGGWGVVILIVLGFAAVLAYERWQRQGSGEALQEIASELGLNVTAVGIKRFQMRGRIDDIGVAVDTELLGGGTELRHVGPNYYTSFKLYAPDGPSGRIVGVSLRQQAIDGWTGEQRMLTGDHAFDEEVFVSGDPATMLAFLNAEARAAVLPAAKAGWSLERATWSALEAGRMTDPDEIRSLLTLGLNAARATRLAGDINTSLQVQAERDPVAGVRAAAAAAQGTSMPALRRALSSVRPRRWLRLSRWAQSRPLRRRFFSPSRAMIVRRFGWPWSACWSTRSAKRAQSRRWQTLESGSTSPSCEWLKASMRRRQRRLLRRSKLDCPK